MADIARVLHCAKCDHRPFELEIFQCRHKVCAQCLYGMYSSKSHNDEDGQLVFSCHICNASKAGCSEQNSRPTFTPRYPFSFTPSSSGVYSGEMTPGTPSWHCRSGPKKLGVQDLPYSPPAVMDWLQQEPSADIFAQSRRGSILAAPEDSDDPDEIYTEMDDGGITDEAPSDQNRSLRYENERLTTNQIRILMEQITTPMDQTSTLTDQNTTLTDQNNTLTDQNERLTDQNRTLKDQNRILTDQNTRLTDQNTRLTDQNTTLADQNTTLTDQNSTFTDQNRTLTDQNKTLTDENRTLKDQNKRLTDQNRTFTEQNTVLMDQIAHQDVASTDQYVPAAHLNSVVPDDTTDQPQFDYRTHRVPARVVNDHGSKPWQLSGPSGLTMLVTSGLLFVADTQNHFIKVYAVRDDDELLYLYKIGGRRRFNKPWTMCLTDCDKIVVADGESNDRLGRVQMLYVNGGVFRFIGDKCLVLPTGLEWNRGKLFVCDCAFIKVFSAMGQAMEYKVNLTNITGSLWALSLVDCRTFLVSETGRGFIHRIGAHNRIEWSAGDGCGPGQLVKPTGLIQDGNGFILVVDSGQNVIQVYRPDSRHFCTITMPHCDPPIQQIQDLVLIPSGILIVSGFHGIALFNFREFVR